MILPNDGKLHFSQLKKIKTSPAHFLAGLTAPHSDSAGMRIGRALHSLYLEGIAPAMFDGVRRGAAWEVEKAKSANPEDILSPAEMREVEGMYNALQKHPDAQATRKRSVETEKSWTAEILGVPCAGKIDLLGPICVDELKSTACAAPGKFLRDADRMWYDAQLAWYQLACGVQWQGPDTEWMSSRIIAVESAAPYVVQVYELDKLRLDQGAEKAFGALRQYKACVEGNSWPGYAAGIQTWDGEIVFGESETEVE